MSHSFTLIFLATLSGFILGIFFTALKLPLPAPPSFAGVMGIVGIYLGYLAWPYIVKFF